MTTPGNPKREHPSTYFVQDRSNEEELLALREMRLPDFEATWSLFTVMGTTPVKTNDPQFLHVP